MPRRTPPAGTRVTYNQQFRRCNKADCPVCRDGAGGHGPYWYAYWREDGRLRSHYIGKQPPPGAEAPTYAVREPHAQGSDQPDGAPPAATATAGALPALRVRTLGSFAVWRGVEPIPQAAWARRTVAALFKCLLVAPEYRVHREAALELLWPEEDPDLSTPKLRLTLFRLRRVLGQEQAGAGYVRLDGELLHLDAAPGAATPDAWLDAAAFEHAARAALAGQDAARCRTALALYTGDYLPGDVYEDWAVVRRETLRQLYVTLLLHLAALCERDRAPGQAMRALRAVLEADSGHEPAARRLMRLHATGGHLAAALQTYERLAETLRREYDLAPDARTQELYRTLRAARAEALARQSNLPAPLSSFVGRRQELAALSALLAGSDRQRGPEEGEDAAPPCRLLTLTGAGGCGKTRLAVELGRQRLDAYADGVWLVELAPLSDEAPIAQEVSRVLGIAAQAGQPPLESLTAGLAGRELLLILDNCEHLIEGCAAVAGALLSACPSLHILATSREALSVLGETVWPVPPLAAPDPRRLPSLRDLQGYAAVRLFVERARAARAGFALTPANSGAVAAICHQLDGIPLAIELAAARLATLPVGDVAARLDDRFRLLNGGNRAGVPRHQTLRAVLDWSYALLDEQERLLLRRLAVFAGGWSVAAAEAVCAADDGDDVAPPEVLALLGRLVGKSLVQPDESIPDADDGINIKGDGGETRYRLLETVRRYAAERLRESGDGAASRDRHLAWYVALAEQAEPSLLGADAERWLARLDREHDNVRAALRWARERGEIVPGLRLAGALAQYWLVRGHLSEGRDWLDGLLGAAPAPTLDAGATAARAKALNGAGLLMGALDDHARAGARYEESLALRRGLGDTAGIAQVLSNLGLLISRQGDHERATSLYEESLALRRELGDAAGVAAALNNLGGVALAASAYQRATAYFEQSLALYRQMGVKRGIAIALSNLGYAAWHEGEYARAAALSEESLALRRELGDREGVAIALTNLGEVVCLQGDLARAARLQAESLEMFRELGEAWGVLYCLQRLALVAQAQEPGRVTASQDRAARLFGALEALRAALGIPLPPNEHARIDPALAALRASLGEAAFAAAWAGGGAMSLEQAGAYALDTVAPLLSEDG